VIRYLTTKVDENIDVAARPSELDDTSFEKAAQTAADEEDLFLSRGHEDLSSSNDDDEDDYVSPDYAAAMNADRADRGERAERAPAAAPAAAPDADTENKDKE
jgi:hypothetical protein